MRYFALIIWFFFLSITASYGQSTISGKVYDSETKKHLSYVNIGIKSKNKGTVTNDKGLYSFKVSNNNLNDSLSFSYVGYFEKTYSISNLLSAKPDSILLKPKTIKLNEIIVSANKKWEIKKLGLKRKLPGVYGIAQSDTIGDIIEVGQQFDLDSAKIKISSFHIYLKNVNIDTANFRINFYGFDGTNRVFDKEIILRKHISNGWLKIDLEEYNIWLSDKILASIEFLPDDKQKDKVSLYYGGILVNKGISYKRTSSLGDWFKLDFGTYSIFLTTKKYLEEKN